MKVSLIKHMFLCMLVAVQFCSCNEEDFEEKYGSGSPLAENVMPLDGYIYEYNEQGLVTKITSIDTKKDENGKETTELVTIATISYPRSDRAVLDYVAEMQYSGGVHTIYTFAFGENHFANRMIELDSDGESYLTKFSYDNDGHLTAIDADEDHLKIEWTNGNMTKLQQDEYHAYAVLTYGSQTDFKRYGMYPFLLYVDLGPFMHYLDWWYDRGLKYALYLGFLGKPCQNLPETIISYDDENEMPQHGVFSYSYYESLGWGTWGIEIQ